MLRIGSVVFDVVKPCERCIFTTVDPKWPDAPAKQPLVTLNQYRAFPAGTLFGQNLVARNSGLLMLGMRWKCWPEGSGSDRCFSLGNNQLITPAAFRPIQGLVGAQYQFFAVADIPDSWQCRR